MMENAINIPKDQGVRSVICRIGIVLGEGDGGGLPWMLPFFSRGLGGIIGSGNQYVPWIHLSDVVNFICQALTDTSFSGPYNLVSPQLITNKELTISLAKILGMPAWVWLPESFARFYFGERACLIVEGRKVIPERIQQETNFKFSFPNLELALKDILKKN